MIGQGYRTPRGAATDEYGVLVDWCLEGENRRIRRKPCSNATFSTTNLTWSHYCADSRMVLNDKTRNILQKAVLAYFKTLLQYSSLWTLRNHENFMIMDPDRGSNLVLPDSLLLCKIWGFHGGEDVDVGLLIIMPCGLVGRYQRFGGNTASIFMAEVHLKPTWCYDPEDQHGHRYCCSSYVNHRQFEMNVSVSSLLLVAAFL
jgi:hypothetical protein